MNKLSNVLLLISLILINGVAPAQRINSENRSISNNRTPSVSPITETGEVVFLRTFEESDSRAGETWRHKNVTVRNGCGVNGSRCAEVLFIPTDEGSERVVFSIPIKPAQEYSLNFDLRFDKNFEFVKGGKIIGLGPADPVTGCNDGRPGSWSQRIMFNNDGTLYNYTYHQNRVERCGDAFDKRRIKIEKDIYYAITMHLKINSEASMADGFSRVYVNGQLTSQIEGIQYRAVEGGQTQIQKLLFSAFHGGNDPSWSPTQPVRAYYDNISVVQGEYVRMQPGLMKATSRESNSQLQNRNDATQGNSQLLNRNTPAQSNSQLLNRRGDPQCQTGIKNGRACCPLSCGSCGGTDCGDRPGGSSACCAGPIRESGISCAVSGPPCIPVSP